MFTGLVSSLSQICRTELTKWREGEQEGTLILSPVGSGEGC